MVRDELTTAFCIYKHELPIVIKMLTTHSDIIECELLNTEELSSDSMFINIRFKTVLDAIYFGINYEKLHEQPQK